MIVRTRPHWFRLLFVWRGSVLGRILPQLFLTTCFSAAVVLAHRFAPGWTTSLTPAPFTLLGIALAIFLGFRNSVSYDRYWEARKLWGAVLNDTRTLTRQITSFSEADVATRNGFVHTLIAFVYALKDQLRGSVTDSNLNRWLSPECAGKVQQARFKPAVILMALAEFLRRLRAEGRLDPILFAGMDRNLSELNEALGGCERIASTPMPFAYSVIIHRTIYLYSFLLPFGLIDTIGLMTPLMVAFISYTFFALEALAEEIQEPFGLEPNDLPLDAMSAMIEVTLREMIGETDLPKLPVAVDHVLT
jgi:ion channel-forming bestrophin family protein